jgi:hypothetical protein
MFYTLFGTIGSSHPSQAETCDAHLRSLLFPAKSVWSILQTEWQKCALRQLTWRNGRYNWPKNLADTRFHHQKNYREEIIYEIL